MNEPFENTASTADRRSLPSLLSPGLRRSLLILLGLSVVLLGNTVYLVGVRIVESLAGTSGLPSVLQSMILLHTGVGLPLVCLFIVFMVAHLPRVWQRYHRASAVSGAAFVLLGVLLAVTGLFILTDAASRSNRWAWWLHVGAAAAVPLAYAAHRLVSYSRPRDKAFRRFASAVATLVVIIGLVHGVEWIAADRTGRPAGAGASPVALTPPGETLFRPAGVIDPASPFFPSAGTTRNRKPADAATLIGPGYERDGERATAVSAEAEAAGFASTDRIGAEPCVRCHADATEQWSTSAHRFSSFNNPFYEATVEELRATPEGRRTSRWCAGCHDPALLYSAQFDEPVDRTAPAAQAGLTCLACHRISEVRGPTGNANYVLDLDETDPYLFAGSGGHGVRGWLHDAVLKARPAVHIRQMAAPVLGQPLICASCHKVSLPPVVNDYRWLRGQNEYDAWHDSGVSLNASRTFYLPAERRICQDCHMPPEEAPLGDLAAEDGRIRSHRFTAANTALPYVRGDTATLDRITRFLQSEKLRVDVFGVASGDADPELGPPDGAAVLVAGETATIDVVVRNLGVGHTFPGGTNDSNEGWLEFSVERADGTLLGQNGSVADDGALDPMAHVFKSVLVAADGSRISHRNGQDIRTAVFVNAIPPGAADLAHYRFTVPRGLEGEDVVLRARLLWRKFDHPYASFALGANPAGFAAWPQGLDLPIREIAATQLRVRVLPQGQAAAPPQDAATDWTRYNDYGIGLLREGSTREATRAFESVARLEPERIDGPLNLARTAVRDGSLERAFGHLETVESIQPGDARAAWVWGRALLEDGQFTRAEAALLRVVESFPGDRAAWRTMGRVLYLDRRYEEALDAFARVLVIDPEDRIAHYHRMLIHRATGRTAQAAEAQAAYEYYRIDESAQEATRAFRLANPGANLMAQPVRTHEIQVTP